MHLKVARVKASNGDERVGIMLDDKLCRRYWTPLTKPPFACKRNETKP